MESLLGGGEKNMGKSLPRILQLAQLSIADFFFAHLLECLPRKQPAMASAQARDVATEESHTSRCTLYSRRKLFSGAD
jgi:hypothetical protein